MVKIKGEFYVDYDEETGCWCVFHTDKDDGKAYASFLDRIDAEIRASEMQSGVLEVVLYDNCIVCGSQLFVERNNPVCLTCRY